MTREEFIAKRKELVEAFSQNLMELATEYVLSNNDVAVGDVISDGITTIRVESIRAKAYRNDTCVSAYLLYKGVQITKKGEPCKNQLRNFMWQYEIKTKNNKTYRYVKLF